MAVAGRMVSASSAASPSSVAEPAIISGSLGRPEIEAERAVLHHVSAIGDVAGAEQHLAFRDGITLRADGKDAQRSGAEAAKNGNAFKERYVVLDRHTAPRIIA